jgi:hypothetical protein
LATVIDGVAKSSNCGSYLGLCHSALEVSVTLSTFLFMVPIGGTVIFLCLQNCDYYRKTMKSIVKSGIIVLGNNIVTLPSEFSTCHKMVNIKDI